MWSGIPAMWMRFRRGMGEPDPFIPPAQPQLPAVRPAQRFGDGFKHGLVGALWLQGERNAVVAHREHRQRKLALALHTVLAQNLLNHRWWIHPRQKTCAQMIRQPSYCAKRRRGSRHWYAASTRFT
jgi:hypothetical protein